MRCYFNKHGQVIWEDVKEDELFVEEIFQEVEYKDTLGINEDFQWAFHSNLGSITVLDRMTGMGWRDTETGYRSPDGKFWLASGMKDVRLSDCETIGDAIEWIKNNANSAIGV